MLSSRPVFFYNFTFVKNYFLSLPYTRLNGENHDNDAPATDKRYTVNVPPSDNTNMR